MSMELTDLPEPVAVDAGVAQLEARVAELERKLATLEHHEQRRAHLT